MAARGATRQRCDRQTINIPVAWNSHWPGIGPRHDIGGIAVHVAARVMGECGPKEVPVSDSALGGRQLKVAHAHEVTFVELLNSSMAASKGWLDLRQ
jgi:hypothetical protein